ncbi:MAG: prolyl oligopeptidase family serine peptidase [Planctomyces sp.]|jgi:pimeloyl-ACP methyl ester carboxylesterase|nr:prolyl oligopeptidase family serine peptidase [Planctomyces sp.]
MRTLPPCTLLLLILLTLTGNTQAQTAELPGNRSTWNGFTRTDFELNGHPVTVIIPRQPADGRPWVWHGEFFGHRPIPDVALLGRGFHIVYTRCSDLFGAPAAVSHWNQVYQTLTSNHGFGPRPALVGTSRGGLYCYNWAAANPTKISCIFGDAPVCDIRSWPMGRGTGKRSDAEVRKLQTVYNITDEKILADKALSPVDHLQPLAAASIPLLHISGDADDIVPIQENTLLLQQRYRALGGTMDVIVKPGIAHVHGLDDSTPIIEFIDKHGRQEKNARGGS